MSGPLDRIRPRISDGQRHGTKHISTNLSAWPDALARGIPWWVVFLNGMMYLILLLAGFGKLIGFSLDPLLLITLVSATVGVSVPYHIRMAINITKGREE